MKRNRKFKIISFIAVMLLTVFVFTACSAPESPSFDWNKLKFWEKPVTGGQNGSNGQDGQDGKDGVTPHIGINGNWWLGSTDTGVTAQGPAGKNGEYGSVLSNGEINDIAPFGKLVFAGSGTFNIPSNSRFLLAYSKDIFTIKYYLGGSQFPVTGAFNIIMLNTWPRMVGNSSVSSGCLGIDRTTGTAKYFELKYEGGEPTITSVDDFVVYIKE